MANLADDIEQFLHQLIRNRGVVEVQRAMLATQFGCVPSQINYVLTTRFTPERGFVVESRRGGGGYIRITRHQLEGDEAVRELLHQQIGQHLSQEEATGYIQYFQDNDIISSREAAIMAAAIQRESIRLDLPVRDLIRASLLKAMIQAVLRS